VDGENRELRLKFIDEEVRDLDKLFGDRMLAGTSRTSAPCLSRTLLRTQGSRPFPACIGCPSSASRSSFTTGNRVITLYSAEKGQPFNDDDLQFLTTIASGAAVAVENAALFKREERLASDARVRARNSPSSMTSVRP